MIDTGIDLHHSDFTSTSKNNPKILLDWDIANDNNKRLCDVVNMSLGYMSPLEYLESPGIVS